MTMTVEWHSCGPYRYSFDVRADASRFIIVRDNPRELLAKGLIEGGPGLGSMPRAIFDEVPARPVTPLAAAIELADLTITMLQAWERMRDRLRADKP